MSRQLLIRRSSFLAVTIVLLLCVVTLAQAQSTRKINWERMHRDLDIMESILNKLLTPSASEWDIWSSNPRGLYFKGYGVVFQVDTDGPHQAVWDAKKQALEKQLIELKARSQQNDKLVTEISRKLEVPNYSTNFSASLEAVKAQLVEFFGTYADAIGQLRRTERITVLAKLRGNNSYSDLIGVSSISGYNPVYMLEASARKSDIIEYRRGRMSEQDFRQSVFFEERMEDDAQTKNLEIMASIMKTALNKKYHKTFGADGNVNGIHLDGLGVLFFMKGNLNEPSLELPELIDLSRKNETVVISTGSKRARRSPRKSRQTLREYKDALIQVVGDYGHTLRTVKSTEHVVVAINFRDSWGPEDVPKRLIMKIRKRDLDRYNRGTIQFAQFRRMVEFKEY
ncbi:hypothetical protein MJD09_06180 [bacterium]|nr:hypothetical protein [bacterium]